MSTSGNGSAVPAMSLSALRPLVILPKDSKHTPLMTVYQHVFHLLLRRV